MSLESRASQENIDAENQLNESPENAGSQEKKDELIERRETNEIKSNLSERELLDDAVEQSEEVANDETQDTEMHINETENIETKPGSKKTFTGVTEIKDLKSEIQSALTELENTPVVEFLQNISRQADIHTRSIQSAIEIARDFVAKTVDLAESMKMILQYDQTMLDKINRTTAHDFGVKPKSDEETRAVMIDRAEKMLHLGHSEYDVSHQISDTAHPLRDYRFKACDDVNAIQDKLLNSKEIVPAIKEVPADENINETEQNQIELPEDDQQRLEAENQSIHLSGGS